jgi:outer membrane protein assembly factor BamB
MHFLSPAQNGCLKMLVFALAAGLFGLLSDTTMGQPNLPVATPARPELVRGSDRRMLDQLQRFLDARQWDDAWELVGRLMETKSSSLVAIDESLYIALPAYCQRLLSRLPPDALTGYRELVDPTAQAWYRQGIDQRDRRPLQRVVDEMFCSSWGDDALMALGELALKRGEYQRARTHWQAIHGGQLELNYSDSPISPADVLARLALVSIRAGQWDRASEEIDRLGRLHPHKRGRLAGREVVYAEQLPKLLNQARQWPAAGRQTDWPTAGGNFARTHAVSTDAQLGLQPLWSHDFASTDQAKASALPSALPIVAAELVIYQDASGVHALQLATGEQAFHADSPTFHSRCSSLTADEHRLFGTATDGTLWGIDLNRDGALFLRSLPGDSATQLAGAPIVDDQHLLLDTRTTDRSVRAGVACFDLATGDPLWTSWLCRANAPIGETGANLLTSSPGVVYVATNLGAIAALRADDGQILWLRTYARSKLTSGQDVACRQWSPAMYRRGVLYVLPADSRQLLALKAATGELLWNRSALEVNAHLVGVTENRIVLSSGGLHLLDRHSGDIINSDFGKQLAGRGVVAGDVLLWPEDQSILRIDLNTGETLPGEITLPESGGANLLAVDNYLLAAGPTQLSLYRLMATQDDQSN